MNDKTYTKLLQKQIKINILDRGDTTKTTNVSLS